MNFGQNSVHILPQLKPLGGCHVREQELTFTNIYWIFYKLSQSLPSALYPENYYRKSYGGIIKMKFREVKQPARGHTAKLDSGEKWDMKSYLLDFKVHS